MKKLLLLLLFVIGTLAVNAQTKEETIAFINKKLQKSLDLETYTSSDNFKTKIKSVKLSIDTAYTVLFETTKEMTYGEKNISVSRQYFDPSEITGIALISEKPNKYGMGYFSVTFDKQAIKAEGSLNGVKSKGSTHNSFSVDFYQKDKKDYSELRTAFLRLRTLYIEMQSARYLQRN